MKPALLSRNAIASIFEDFSSGGLVLPREHRFGSRTARSEKEVLLTGAPVPASY
jgi:hypothetical protein